MLLAVGAFSGFGQGNCGYQFVDNGGITADYLPNSEITYTLCPNSMNDKVTVTFTSFNTEAQYDAMFVFNGAFVDDDNQIMSGNPPGQGPFIFEGSFWGTDIPGPFTSTSPDGCLTFVFRSDGSTQRSGWIANVTCGPDKGFILTSFLDVNNNGLQETNEPNFPTSNFSITNNSSGNVSNINSYNGSYIFFENNPAVNYNFSCNLDPIFNGYYSVATTNFTNVTIDNSLALLPIQFPVTSLNTFNDLSINISNLNPPRAGFDYISRIYYTNYGNQTIANGAINFTNDAATAISATSVPVTTTTNGFTYNFANLLPCETRTIDVTMSVPSIPTVAIGQAITNNVDIATTAAETSLTNNNSNVSTLVVASYDPNDITEAHGPEILYSSFAPNDYLTYTIRFENTGNAPAEKVRIINPLDTAINETSVKIVSSSNNYVLERIANNLTFKFDNIQLPPSVPNTAIGKGFVTYKAKLKPGFAVGSIIPNTAKIYFDTNPAIDTNIFETKFVSVLANANFNTLNDFKVYPNPVKNLLLISNKNNSKIQSAEISNMLGQTFQMSINNNNIDVSDLKSGSYMLKIISEKGTSNTKFIKE